MKNPQVTLMRRPAWEREDPIVARTHRPVVVVGYDGSEASHAAVTAAAWRAGRGGLVIVVHAYRQFANLPGAPGLDGGLAERRDHGRALLDALPLSGNDELLDTTYESELVEGPPAQAIADIARTREADEIVVGARGLGRVRVLLGSVSGELLRIADCPVLVIPPGAVGAVQQGRAAKP